MVNNSESCLEVDETGFRDLELTVISQEHDEYGSD